MSLRRYIAQWGARFDTRALRPPPAAGTVIPGGPQPSAQTPPWNSLLAWCQAGSGPGNCRWWQPGGQPTVAQRLAVATLRGPDEAALRELADALARQLDDSCLLAAQPHRATAIALRLHVKLHDAMWWRQRQPQDPWDAGWALATAAGLARLQSGFAPRRATLILADGQQADTLQAALVALASRCSDFHQPVRWLWVGGDGELPPPPGQALARFRRA